jgi:HAE1 family hydrophobic/amphiphilic exporter-1
VRLADLAIRRPVFAVMLIGALVSLGLVSVGRLGVDLMPRIEFPYVSVTTVLEGATPETVETEVTDIIEEQVNAISGIKRLKSVSSEGLSQVFVQFELEEDVDIKAQDVREKVARARRDLPADAEPPLVEKLDMAASPILAVMVSGELPIREITRFADDVVKERLQRIRGVGSATVVGGRKREIRIWIDANRLRSYALTVDDVIRAIRSEHTEIPGGRFETLGGHAELSVKTKGEVEAVREFNDIVVAYREGTPTLIRDVARVEDGLEDERTYAELDGVRGVSLEVRKQSGRNTVEVARAVRTAVEDIQQMAPPGIRVIVAHDTSRFIESSIEDVAQNMVLGGFLAVLITLAFLRSFRSTLIVSIAIPAAIVSTFFLFYVIGITINMLTLLGLSVSIGLLIDDGIVVLESIYRRIEAGEAPMRAASEGAERVGSAVVAGSASVLAVFLPIAFMKGMIGRAFYEYGLAVAFSVAVSLLIAVTLTPTLCARVLRRQSSQGRVFLTLERLYTNLEHGYGILLATVLRHRLATMGVAVLSIYVGISLAGGVPLEFAPSTDRSEFEGVVEIPLGAGIEESKRVGRRVATAVAAIPEVEGVFLTVGGGSRGRVNESSLYIALSPKLERDASDVEVKAVARQAMAAAAPEAKAISANEISWISGGGVTPYDVEYSIQGPELGRLEELSDHVLERMQQAELFVDTITSFERGKPEVQVLVDRRRAADLGVPVRSLATTVRALVGGLDVATYQEAGSRYDVRVRLEEEQRDEVGELGRIQVRAASGGLVDLENLATIRIATGPAQVDRLNRARRVTIHANTIGGVALETAVNRLDEIVAEIGLPAGYEGAHQGAAERMTSAAESMVFAFVMALIAIYVILASQFNSFIQPAVIMVSAPLAFVGAFTALWITSTEMNIFAQIGLIALMGLVMKNGILLVDYANRRRAEGATAHEAILEAGAIRLRPVLMTALSTIFGMLPVALSRSDAAEFRNPMGVILIGGLLSSTFLTLLVVPVIYTLADGLRALPMRLWARAAPFLAPVPSPSSEAEPPSRKTA